MPPGGTVPLQARLELGGRVQVRVVDRKGRLVAPGGLRLVGRVGAYFIAVDSEGAWISTPLQRAIAHVTATAIPPGRYTVEGVLANQVYARAEVFVEIDKTVEVTLQRLR